MEKISKILEILERTVEDLRKLQVEDKKQIEFEIYVVRELEKINKDLAEIKKAII